MIHFAERLKLHFVPQHSPREPRSYCVNSKIVTDTYRVESSSSIIPASSISTSIQSLHAADFSLDFQQAAGNPITSLLFPCSLQNNNINLANIFEHIEQQQQPQQPQPQQPQQPQPQQPQQPQQTQ